MKNNEIIIAIIVTFNRKELLIKVLDSLLSQTVSLNKIIVVDNNSSDGTNVIVSEYADKFCSIIYNNTGANLGGAGGFHFGMNYASDFDYDRLWLMDDDIVPHLNCLEIMLQNDLGDIIQPLRLNTDGSCAELSPVVYDLSSIFLLNPKRDTVISTLSNKTIINDAIPLHGIPFEGPLIKKNVIDTIGLPNKKFFIFYDDLDYSIRARDSGFKIYCDLNAKATRLLINIQKNDLKSWKGYFMLRNLFYILRTYGKNSLVRSKPLLITMLYCTKSILSLDLKSAKKVVNAYKDSYKLSNTERYKP